MVNKYLIAAALAALLLTHFTATAAPSVGDIAGSQQSTIMLKSALERAKLEKELSDMKDVKVSATELCTSKGIGMLSMKAIYGVGNKLYGSFYYNSTSTMEARVGDTLLCGEKVKTLRLDKVEVVKDNITYVLSGSSHAVAKY